MFSRASCPDMAMFTPYAEPGSRALRIRVGPVMHALQPFVHYHIYLNVLSFVLSPVPLAGVMLVAAGLGVR